MWKLVPLWLSIGLGATLGWASTDQIYASDGVAEFTTSLVDMLFGVQLLSNSALNTPILEIRFHDSRPELPGDQNKKGHIGVEAL